MAECLWRQTDPAALIWESWGSAYGVFDRSTGETHLINELPAEVLRRLSGGPQSARLLAHAIAEDCDIEYDPAWQRKIESILQSLHTLRLIEQIQD